MSTDEKQERQQLRAALREVLAEYREQFEDAAAAMLRADLSELLLEPPDTPRRPRPSRTTGTQPAEARESTSRPFPDLIGECPKMLELYDLVQKVAATDTTVYIHGESGVGKELIAKALHDASRRKGKAYVAENCAALPETLLESELFGHKRGAFTGADRNRVGRFQAADGGTLFLDEVGDMSMSLQKKLLRALQDGEIRPVGGQRTLHVDVRVLSASNKDLQQMVSDGRFREDLFYRLSPIRVEVPPLRERGKDVLLLVDHFAALFADRMGREKPEFTAAAEKALLAYRWPGNVRELQNELQRVLALTPEGRTVDLADLSTEVQGQH